MPGGQVADQQARAVRGGQHPADAPGERGHDGRVGAPPGPGQRPRGREHRQVRDVGGNREVDRTRGAQRRAQHPVDLLRGGGGTQVGLGRGDLGRHPGEVTVVAARQVVMQRGGGFPGGQGRGADDVHDGHGLGVGARDRVHRGQLADAERGDQGADPPLPGVAVGGVAGALLGGHADPGQAGPGGDGVEDGQVVVTGHAEDRDHAGFGQAGQQVTGHRGDPRRGDERGVRRGVGVHDGVPSWWRGGTGWLERIRSSGSTAVLIRRSRS